MPQTSAGILLFRRTSGLEVLLAHPGGPYWARKDLGAWTIPKGLVANDEELLDAARREFEEETGYPPQGPFLPLGSVRLKSGKTVHGWAAEGDLDPDAIESNTFTVEWPPRSGNQQEFPEIDRAGFFALDEARAKIHPGQFAFLERLEQALEE